LADYEKDYHVHLGDEHYHIDIPVVRSVQVEGNSTMFKEVQGSRVPSLTFCGYAQHCVAYSCGYVPFLFTN